MTLIVANGLQLSVPETLAPEKYDYPGKRSPLVGDIDHYLAFDTAVLHKNFAPQRLAARTAQDHEQGHRTNDCGPSVAQFSVGNKTVTTAELHELQLPSSPARLV
ncbi:MAG: hypothetical protein LC770_01340 [Acidobacteria bacterium]|nr:hypothetical protein [Acidobacteriota bacterium]